VLPVLFEGNVKAVIELASFQRFSTTHQDFLDQLTESIGIVLNTIEANMRTEELLKQSQTLAQELQSQQEELRHTNEELEQKAQLLAEQNREVERKNLEVEQAKASLEEKATQLAITSKYKSEFLANMSHELRTPLNSLMILAQQLRDNVDGNLTPKQIEFASIILSSGSDLLNLINDILDLSKIESGTVVLDLETVPVDELRDFIDRTFRHIAEGKGLAFSVDLDANVPKLFRTDRKRMQQIVGNLLSNACKFTEHGRVHVAIDRARAGWSPTVDSLNRASAVVAVSVTDTGIGIPLEKQRVIFEPFQQADGTTTRRYGGTGLGLSISRELAQLLGGEIRVESEPGRGSTFTVFLPLDLAVVEPVRGAPGPASNQPPARPYVVATPEFVDDRATISKRDSVVLIVEDDVNFAKVLLDLAHQGGFKGLVALDGASAVEHARNFHPNAITLDLGLRDTDGWEVLEKLHADALTRDIPIHIISVHESDADAARKRGISFLTKPVDKGTLEDLFHELGKGDLKRVLVIEDDAIQRESIVDALVAQDIEVVAVATAKEALVAIKRLAVDCIVLDLILPDMHGSRLLARFRREPKTKRVPIVVYTAADLTPGEQSRIESASGALVFKSPHSSEQLLNEVSGFLRRVGSEKVSRQPAEAATPPVPPTPTVDVAGRTVLIVDDDIRNIFALTSVLERHGMNVLAVESGPEAIDLLDERDDVDVVLMDIMMPEMDGFETIGLVRQEPARTSLPIIALTAKAMPGDRERCLEAGANDYLAKPVDTTTLLMKLGEWTRKPVSS
jgi:signal transduction histidine kinase/CheY-like chemotaxis protein